MNIIKKIVNDNGYTIKQLEGCRVCNGCGGKGGVNFESLMKALPYFQKEKGRKLLRDLHLVCYLHDICFSNGGGFIVFIKCNYKLAYNIMRLLYWTNTISRLIVFIIVFMGTLFFGWRYFNWTNK